MSVAERSLLINDEENRKFMSLIESKCKILYFTVARLYQAYNNEWRHINTGLLTLTKDNARKKYFLEIYNIEKSEKCFEQMVPISFNYNVYKKQIHTFTADDVPTLLSFANLDESTKFHEEIRKLQNQRKEQKETKKRKSQINSTDSAPTDFIMPLKQPVQQPQKNVQGKKTKISKSDISNPTNFKHVDHMGLHDHFFENPEDEKLRNFLKEANMEVLLDNENSKRDLYEFIDQRGGLKKFESEIKQQQQMPTRKAPPVPQKVPPPPPGRSQYVAPMPQVHKPPPSGHMAPPPPPSSSAAPPPPPPPPPPPAPAPPPMHFAPKPTSNAPPPPAPTGKGGLLAEIEKFDAKKLKARSQAEADEVAAPAPAAGGSLLDSLAQYLVQRKNLLTGTSDDEGSDDNDEEDEDWKD